MRHPKLMVAVDVGCQRCRALLEAMIRFNIESEAPVPVTMQIQEQIRLALSLGTLRSGDILPSIRDVAAQTGINRGKVYQAYRALEQLGVLQLHRGKSVIAAGKVSSREQVRLHDRCQRLSRTVVARARQLGVSPTALARYTVREAYAMERAEPFIAFVAHKAFAQEVASEISRLWNVCVIGLTHEELQDAVRNGSRLRKILAHRLRIEQIRSLVRNPRIDVIPIGTRLSDETLRAYKRFAPTASVVLFLHPQEYSSRQFILEQSGGWIRSRDLSAALWKGAANFKQYLKDGGHDHIVVDQHMWSELPPEMRGGQRIVVGRIQLDLPSVEAARIRAGVII